jgi:hypothetical protein
MNKLKAKFNVEKILNGRTIYPKDFIDLVIKYETEIIEVEEEVFGGYELELEGRTFALDDDELILIKGNLPNSK